MTATPDLRIEPAAMEQYVETLGAIGWQPGGGIIRPVFGSAWVEARAQVGRWMAEAGLDVREDAVGNLFGRLRGRDDRRTILTGSHIDTVRLGGKFDGALGVLAALAAVARLARAAGTPARSLEVVALCEEEGSRFHANFWGTRGILGLIQPEELDRLRDDEGISIGEAMRAVGLAPERYREARRDDLDAFIELHIEQGRILFEEGVEVGVVDRITGITQLLATVEGRTDHAGTTPMDLRRDAFQGAAEMALAITRQAEQEGRPAVATTGHWDVRPGAWNIVPGTVAFSIDLRHPDDALRQRLVGELSTRCQEIAAARRLQCTLETVQEVAARDMDGGLRELLRGAAQRCGVSQRSMVSGAGHDSQVMATRVPTAMLFVPSVDGRSHSAAEHTTPEDAATGATVLATALHQLAY